MIKARYGLVFLSAVLILLTNANVTAQEELFYQGKTIKIVAGFTSGGFYDRWSRLLARHVPRFIPGNPEILVQPPEVVERMRKLLGK